MLDSHFPMFVAWGDELRFFYNDAYSEILGDKHPQALGARFKDVWTEIWIDILPLIEKAMAGIATYSEDLPLLMNRRGYNERSWFTFSYSPVRDEHGIVRGMFCAVTETTERVLLERRQSFHLELEERLREMSNPVDIMAAAAEALGWELDIARVGYGEIDETEEHVIVERDWTDGRIPSVAGTYRMNDFGPPIIEELKHGRVIFIDDVDDDPRVGTMVAAFRAIGSRTVLAVPLNKEGRFNAMLFLHHPHPHRWTENHIALATEVAERTWSAVERAKAEVEKARSTARLHFLDALANATSVMTDADAILEKTTQMLGEHLGVSVCAYADMDEDQDGFTIRGDWAAPGAAHIVGRYRLRDFGRLAVSELSSARPLIINDNSEIAAEEAATFQSIGIAATICMPLVKAGRLTALMAVHRQMPHKWSAAELALVREVADRSWAHVERVRTEAELVASQEDLRKANENLEATVAERTAELMAAEDSLRQAQKMEAVGQLTGGLAHDFNNLLAGVIGSLEVMKNRAAQGRYGELDRYINAASGAAKRGAALTQRMLAFSRRQTLDPRPADVNELVNSMAELIRGSVGPAIAVDIAHTDALWSAFVDVGQLENSLLNLCINGRDAMPDGGKLTIETANRSMSGRHALTLGLSPGQYISICVSDTGTGMSSEIAARAFDPFFTTKPTGQGTGLGLSMVWGFAGQSGGSVRIQTEEGRGTSVCIYLPRHSGQIAVEKAEVREQLALDPVATKTILLVDDEPLVRMIAAEHLEDLGWRVIQAGDANEALNVLRSAPEIDVLVTDVGLPHGMNGRQLADAIRVEVPSLPILFITGYAENAILNHGHLEPGMQVLTKPFDMDVFAERVRVLSASPMA